MAPADSDTSLAPTFPDRLLRDAQGHMEMTAALALESARSKEIAARQQQKQEPASTGV